MSGGHAKSKSYSIEITILSFFRYLIGYIERLFRNTISQIKYVLSKGKELYNYIITTQFSTKLNLFVKVCIVVVIVILSIPFLMLLFLWAMLKSV